MSDISKQIKELNKQLYPTGRAWNYVHGSEQVDTGVTNFVDGLGNPFVDSYGNAFIQTFSSEASPSKRLVNTFLLSYERFYQDLMSLLNQFIADNEDFDETDASNWERIFGLISGSLTLDERKASILRRQSFPTGIEERGNYQFIQDQLQAAGFDVYVTENRFWNSSSQIWEVVDPDVAVSENTQMGNAYLGEAELGGLTVLTAYSICANYIEEELDATFFDRTSSENQLGTSQMGNTYFDNYTQSDASDYLKATFFISGSDYPSFASISADRKKEFRQLLLRLKPAQTVAFLYVNYI